MNEERETTESLPLNKDRLALLIIDLPEMATTRVRSGKSFNVKGGVWR